MLLSCVNVIILDIVLELLALCTGYYTGCPTGSPNSCHACIMRDLPSLCPTADASSQILGFLPCCGRLYQRYHCIILHQGRSLLISPVIRIVCHFLSNGLVILFTICYKILEDRSVIILLQYYRLYLLFNGSSIQQSFHLNNIP